MLELLVEADVVLTQDLPEVQKFLDKTEAPIPWPASLEHAVTVQAVLSQLELSGAPIDIGSKASYDEALLGML